LQARTLLLVCVSYPRVRDVHHGSFTPAAPDRAIFFGQTRAVFLAPG
jgi:hypothetical protein